MKPKKNKKKRKKKRRQINECLKNENQKYGMWWGGKKFLQYKCKSESDVESDPEIESD